METQAEDTVRTNMESMRLICDREIPKKQQKMDAVIASFRKSLESIGARAQETVQNHGKLGELKAKLREAEDEMVKALAVKTRKEAKRMAIMDSISAQKARVEELKRSVQEQKAKRNQYAATVSQQSLALAASEEKSNEEVECKGETQEAISWYNRVLGFHVEGGPGVKFTFKNINLKNPNEEYSFTIRYAYDTYTLLDCDPHLNDTKELIHELNKTNGLFKFVRIMREKFQEAVAQGFLPQLTTHHQESSTISTSAPSFSVSTDKSESSVVENDQVKCGEGNRPSKKAHHARAMIPAILSPGSASSLRRSPRFKE
ncbi:kinetochore protein SPC25 homolog isoform X2 [Alnus glutinosa]|uniref:kinetochore protein SPC25 homolog isoform X2 n=1 Tax=Alnus glutinosa TaxID=3517 RepID=UPI002D7791AF|nr:kinetochore protein SPC25 homolog isoform X2 [Alnus glutinosa]